MWKIVAGIAILAVYSAVTKGDRNDAVEPAASAAVPEKLKEISAGAILQAYRANEVAADLRFKDQRYSVTGTVTRVAKSVAGSPQVWLNSDSVVVNGLSEGQALAIRPGDFMSFKCSAAGLFVGILDLDCG